MNRWRAYLVDRKKDVIICGGENVFPVEAENHMHTHPLVKDAAVIGHPDESEIPCNPTGKILKTNLRNSDKFPPCLTSALFRFISNLQ